VRSRLRSEVLCLCFNKTKPRPPFAAKGLIRARSCCPIL